MWGTLVFPRPPRHLMMFSTRKFGREFLYPQLHHVMDFPCPSFPCFFGKCHGKPPKKQRFFIPTEPLKSLEKKGKTLKKTRNFSQGKKQGIPQKQGKEGQGSFPMILAGEEPWISFPNLMLFHVLVTWHFLVLPFWRVPNPLVLTPW